MLPLESIKPQIDELLARNTIPGRVLLDRMRVIDESSRKTGAYGDPRYAPFYYHLGKILEPAFMCEVGFNLGLLSACFLKSCKTVTRFLGFQEQKAEYYSPRLGIGNIRDNFKKEIDVYVGQATDEAFTQKISPNSMDLVILNEEAGFDKHLLFLDLLWPYLSENGIIVAEYVGRHKPARDALAAFCESKNRIPVTFETRYGTSLVQK